MELKKYQQDIINNLEHFLEKLQVVKDLRGAFHEHWADHPVTPLQPFPGKVIEPYKNNIPAVPHVCIKVPTAGGKTFIACNAIKTIFDAFHFDKEKAVVWLVPSITILDQTFANLNNPSHPYRQKLNMHFGNKVGIFDKSNLLQGNGFNPVSVKEKLNIFVLSFDSLRAKKKEDRKVFQENGNLQSFESMVGLEEEISLMKVIQTLNPVVVVDESHNAESDLSVEMLKNLNPCFILDLTATPRKNSNIIGFTDAIELKKENMVKLPVIVYNHNDKTGVVSSAIQLQKKLELLAEMEEKNGGKYIRPIVLFQAQPRVADDNTTFEKLKEKLIESGIPQDQIRIKTAEINEIKGEDLLSRNCPVRFIITVNALKEGWDCPFAYILASLADKSSSIDVEQIVGRVLRQPYVSKHESPMLNMSYVLTASAKFLDTLDNIVKGLNKAGFSTKDYKVAENVQIEVAKADPITQLTVFAKHDEAEDGSDDIDSLQVLAMIETHGQHLETNVIEQVALEQSRELQRIIEESNSGKPSIPTEIQPQVKSYTIKEFFKDAVISKPLPQFYFKIPANDLFGIREEDVLLEHENLLEKFQLSKCDTNIVFDDSGAELYKVDLDETSKDFVPRIMKIDGNIRESLMKYLLDPAQKDARAKILTRRFIEQIGKTDPIPHIEIEKYITRVISDLTEEQFEHLLSYEHSYVQKIKEKISALAQDYTEKKFQEMLDTDQIFLKYNYRVAESITPANTSKDLTKSLYEKEAGMNSFEEKVINEVANLPNILCWTRNMERKGYCINGFINHYPDFIIYTKSGKVVLLETKGDHLDAEPKIRLGNLWISKCSNEFKYFMVYENRSVRDAYTQEGFMQIIKNL